MKLAEFKNWPGDERFLFVQLESKRFVYYEWIERDFKVGFSCIPPGKIQLGTFYDGDYEGWLNIEVFLLPNFSFTSDNAAHLMRLPFVVLDNELVFIGTFYIDSDAQRREQTVQIPPGNYALYYETGLLRPFDELQKEYVELDPNNEEAMSNPSIWCQLSFVLEQDVEPAILRAEPGFLPPM